jgi:MFS family permease
VADTEAKRSWGRYGARPARVLALVALIDSIDRGILPGVLTKVQDDLGFSDTQMGTLAAAFILAGFVVTLPSGYLADRQDRRRIISIVLASWGIVSALNSLVRTFWQFLLVRSALGVGETIDNPSSQSLLADYYPPDVRGRAFALQRVAPILGGSIGLGLGGLVGSTLGWRWAFLLVGVPGSLLAIAVWRLPEPARGESDRFDPDLDVIDAAEGSPAIRLPVEVPPPPSEGELHPSMSRRAAMMADVRQAMQVRTLRSLMAGTAIAAGALQGLAFWASAFYERHSSLGEGSTGVVAGLIAIGALGGTFVAGQLVDRMHDRVEGFPMLLAGSAQIVGATLLMMTFLPVPLWLRLPVQTVAVACIVGGLLPLAVMIAQVVPAALRGAAFSITGFLGALAGAASPQAIGIISDRFEITVDGEPKGDLAKAFLIMTPLVLIGGYVVLRGRRFVSRDIARVGSAGPAGI